MIFANSLDQDQAQQNVRPDLDPNCLTLQWYFENANFEKNSRQQKSIYNNPAAKESSQVLAYHMSLTLQSFCRIKKQFCAVTVVKIFRCPYPQIEKVEYSL